MLKLLIVDDEPMSRDRIRSFPLEGCDFYIAGEAENGQDALERIDELKPDIVVTDIVMPVMDGLALLENVQSRPQPPKVIMLTCYDDFDKIQAALRLGAQDYIIKLMLDEADFIRSVNKVAATVVREQMEKNRVIRNLVERMLHAHTESAAGQQLKPLCDAGFTAPWFKLVMLSTDSLFMQAVSAQNLSVDDMPGKVNCLMLELSEDQLVLLLYADQTFTAGQFEAACDQFCSAFCDRFSEAAWGKLRFHLISGRTGSGAEAIRQAYLSLLAYEKQLFYDEPTARLLWEKSECQPFGRFQTCDFNRIVWLCRQSFEECSYAQAFSHLFDFVERVKEIRPVPEEVKTMARTLAACIPVEFTMPVPAGVQQPVQQWLEQTVTASASMRAVACAFSAAAVCVQGSGFGRHNGMRVEIKQALDFIDGHFFDDIGLQNVSDHVNLSLSWFGSLFKAEVGQSFSDYLIHYRVEKAKQLLSRTNLTVNQVADNVGIHDPHYFSRVFTRLTGLGPKEFRKTQHYKCCGTETGVFMGADLKSSR